MRKGVFGFLLVAELNTVTLPVILPQPHSLHCKYCPLLPLPYISWDRIDPPHTSHASTFPMENRTKQKSNNFVTLFAYVKGSGGLSGPDKLSVPKGKEEP